MRFLIILSLVFALSVGLKAQTDSASILKTQPHTLSHSDSLYLAKLNTSGNFMIAGGVGLCGVSAYLIYYGISVYNTAASPASVTNNTQAQDINHNHQQGTVYLAAGVLAAAGGVALISFGAMRKHEFKWRKRMMTMQAGILPTGGMLLVQF